MGILNTKKAFTMAEAILVMTILGIIATIMITTLKPAQFKDKGLEIMARKVLSEIDTAMAQIIINDTANGSLTTTINPDTGQTYYFSNWDYEHINAKLLKKYLTATRQEVSNNSYCKSNTGGSYINETSAFYLKDGACIGIHVADSASVNTIFPGETTTTPVPLTSIEVDTKAMAVIFVDTNGDEEPNVLGKDRFALPVGQYGIMYALD